MCAFGGTDALVAKLIELIKVRQLDFELQRSAATLAPRQRNEDASIETALLRACSSRRMKSSACCRLTGSTS